MFGIKLRPLDDEKRARELAVAELVTEMGDSPGWECFQRIANTLADTYTPDIAEFNSEGAVSVASRMAFVSGIRRCIGLMDQQRDILQSLKRKPENN